ncbi:hypothetical protein V8J82_12755 [Gymnodinialimonas sp. 2305UL16-5]|uniref:hypothetical protein n=1 Tax=Gymnodinialimonas mytili TaxID=3126503 RepID=UPI003099CA51
MQILKTSLLTLIAALFISAGSPAAAQTFQVPVTGDFREGDITFTGQYGTVYYFLWDARIQDGRLAICGVGYTRDARFRTTIRRMARDGSLRINNSEIPFDMSFFTRATTRPSLTTTAATCQFVPGAPTSGQLQMRFGDGVFRN